MKKDFSTEAKVGLFVVMTLAIIAYITIEVSNLSLTPGGTYTVYSVLDNAEGITKKKRPCRWLVFLWVWWARSN